MKLDIKAGSTSQSVTLFIPDSSNSTGAGRTGLVYNSSGLIAYYARPRSAAVAITLATQTVTGGFSSGGFVEIDATHLPGVYRLDLPDAALAAGVNSVVVMLSGAANMAPTPLVIELTAYDPYDSTRLGLAAVPNASAGASGGLPTIDASLRTLSNLDAWRGTQPNVLVSGRVDTSAGAVADKTGFALTGADKDDIVDLVWDENASSSHQTAGSAGRLLNTRLTGGAGALSRTLGITVAGTPLQGASVWLSTDAGGASIVAGPLVTNSMGVVTLLLDAGAYYAWLRKDGYNAIAAQPVTIS